MKTQRVVKFASGLAAMMAMPLLLVCSGVMAAEEDAADHSNMDHDMAGHSSERDEMGRRLHGMKHNVTPEIVEELRQKVIGWEDVTDAEVQLSMQMMGSNYEWYISDDDINGDTGVLILLHGFGDRGDKVFKEQIQPYADIFPTALSFGMSMMMSQHIQLGLDDLVAAGAKNIVVVPIVATEHNTMIRQWQYIFGLYDEATYASVPPVKTDANIKLIPPPGDDPFVAEILLDFAEQISTDPSKEVVIIVGHGPSAAADNQKQLALMDNLARIVQEDGGYSAVLSATLQDDAPLEVRDQNVAKLRGMIEAVKSDGKAVILVTNLIGAYTIQSKLRKDLEGLDYKFNAKGLVEHEKFVQWIGESVRNEIERNWRPTGG
jgi:sirohydrochlorin cobaltochelatase